MRGITFTEENGKGTSTYLKGEKDPDCLYYSVKTFPFSNVGYRKKTQAGMVINLQGKYFVQIKKYRGSFGCSFFILRR